VTRNRTSPVRLWDVSAEPIPPTLQLLVYRFGAGADYEGRLVGALERIESGGAPRATPGPASSRRSACAPPAAASRRC
jgi:hypothetical protein